MIRTTLLFLVLFCGLLFFDAGNNTHAASQYTTQGATQTKKQAKKDAPNKPKCSQNDIFKIKQFDRAAKRQIKNHQELSARSAEISTPAEAERFGREITTVYDFFQSDEYDAMKLIYERCNLTIPSLGGAAPYWQQ